MTAEQLELPRLSRYVRAGRNRWLNLLQRSRLAHRRARLTPARARARPGPRVATVGLMRSSSGLGESARIFTDACRASGLTVMPVDLSDRMRGFDSSVAFETSGPHGGSRMPERHADTIVVHLNGPLSVDALAALDLPSVERACRIAYWHWELPRIPDSWRRSADYFNEIWVPSGFVRDAVAPYVSAPVRVLPHCLGAAKPLPGMRRRVGIAEDAFVALTVFDFRSSIRRKNPVGAIEAFRRAFGDDPSAHLVVKATHGALFPRETAAVRAAIGDSTNIRLVDDVLSRAEMWGLVEAADVVLSLHRSEGFGLVPAEAMLLGKPVLSTDWSATREFLHGGNGLPVPCDLVPVVDPVQYRGFEDQLWAEPKVDVAAEQLAALRAEPERRRRIGARARADALRLFAPERYQARLRELLTPETEPASVTHPILLDRQGNLAKS